MDKKHSVLLVILAASVMILCVCIYIRNNYSPEKKNKADQTSGVITVYDYGTNEPIKAPTSDYILNSEPHSITDNYIVDGTTLISKNVTYPEIIVQNCKYTDEINKQIKVFSEMMLKIDGESKNSALEKYTDGFGEFDEWEFSADFEVGLYGNFVSVLFDCSDYCGGADSEHYFKSVCFDLNTGNTAAATDILPDADAVLKSGFLSVISDSPENFYGDCGEILNSLDFSNNLYFEKNGISAYINPGVISPSVFGIIKILIPQSER